MFADVRSGDPPVTAFDPMKTFDRLHVSSTGMLAAYLLFASLSPRSTTQSEFVRQAQACGVSLKYDGRGEEGYSAWLAQDGMFLFLRENRPKEQVECMRVWAERRGLIIVYERN